MVYLENCRPECTSEVNGLIVDQLEGGWLERNTMQEEGGNIHETGHEAVGCRRSAVRDPSNSCIKNHGSMRFVSMYLKFN